MDTEHLAAVNALLEKLEIFDDDLRAIHKQWAELSRQGVVGNPWEFRRQIALDCMRDSSAIHKRLTGAFS